MAMLELKPCPFCGTEDVKAESSSGAWFISCNTEDCSLGFVDDFNVWQEDAIVRWNTRPLEDKNET